MAEILTLEDAAARLKRSKRTLYRWTKEPGSPFRKRGNRWYVVADDLREWVCPKEGYSDPMPPVRVTTADLLQEIAIRARQHREGNHHGKPA